MIVKNINRTGDNTIECEDRLRQWIDLSSQPLPETCSAEYCDNRPEVGAHVQKDSFIDNNWYIVPLCRKHNALTGKVIAISDNTELVPVNASQVFGK